MLFADVSGPRTGTAVHSPPHLLTAAHLLVSNFGSPAIANMRHDGKQGDIFSSMGEKPPPPLSRCVKPCSTFLCYTLLRIIRG